MMKLSLGNYFPGNSFLHRLDPRVKIAASILLMIFLFMLTDPIPLISFGVMLLLVTLWSRIPPKLVLRSVKPVMFLALIALLINVFTIDGNVLWSWRFLHITAEGLSLGLRMGIRLFYLVMSTQLCLTLTTTPLEIADGVESLLQPLARFGFPARGLVSVLIPLFVSAFKRAEDLATAMEARCYRGGEGRTKLRVLRYQRSDFLSMILIVVFCAALLLMQILL